MQPCLEAAPAHAGAAFTLGASAARPRGNARGRVQRSRAAVRRDRRTVVGNLSWKASFRGSFRARRQAEGAPLGDRKRADRCGAWAGAFGVGEYHVDGVFLCVIVWLVLSVGVLLASGPCWSGLGAPGACRVCRYSLAGLRAGSECPECGAQDPDVRPARRLRACPASAAECRWLASVAFALCGAMLSYPLAEFVLACSYRVMGYGWETSYLAAQHRELSSPEWSAAAAMWPVCGALVLSPLCALLPTLRATVLAMALGTGGAILVSVALCVLPHARL